MFREGFVGLVFKGVFWRFLGVEMVSGCASIGDKFGTNSARHVIRVCVCVCVLSGGLYYSFNVVVLS